MSDKSNMGKRKKTSGGKMRKDRWTVMAVGGGKKRGWEVRILVEEMDREQKQKSGRRKG